MAREAGWEVSYEELRCNHVKARKHHTCEWCGTAIQRGEKCMYRAYKFEGDFNHGWMHLECEHAMNKSPWDEVSEGFISGEQGRGCLIGSMVIHPELRMEKTNE